MRTLRSGEKERSIRVSESSPPRVPEGYASSMLASDSSPRRGHPLPGQRGHVGHHAKDQATATEQGKGTRLSPGTAHPRSITSVPAQHHAQYRSHEDFRTNGFMKNSYTGGCPFPISNMLEMGAQNKELQSLLQTAKLWGGTVPLSLQGHPRGDTAVGGSQPTALPGWKQRAERICEPV